MTSIADTLRRFNRKERYWVVRTALGQASQRLDEGFCAKLEEALLDRDVHIDPANAWWAMDYHFNWLYAALRMHCEGAQPGVAHSNGPGAIRGNQEDIDLVVVTGRDVILVEAKTGAWSSDQLRSKLERLRLLGADDQGLVGSDERSVRLHFVLMSPKRSTRSELGVMLDAAPAWIAAKGAKAWRWVKLYMDEPGPDCRVHLSNPEGRKDKAGVHWAINASVDAGAGHGQESQEGESRAEGGEEGKEEIEGVPTPSGNFYPSTDRTPPRDVDPAAALSAGSWAPAARPCLAIAVYAGELESGSRMQLFFDWANPA